MHWFLLFVVYSDNLFFCYYDSETSRRKVGFPDRDRQHIRTHLLLFFSINEYISLKNKHMKTLKIFIFLNVPLAVVYSDQGIAGAFNQEGPNRKWRIGDSINKLWLFR